MPQHLDCAGCLLQSLTAQCGQRPRPIHTDRFYAVGPNSPDYHPEYFAQRYPIAPAAQLDYSNQNVIDQVAADAAAYYDTYGPGASPFNVVPSDNFRWCTCNDCTTGPYAWTTNSSG
jgi:hypothetical protein